MTPLTIPTLTACDSVCTTSELRSRMRPVTSIAMSVASVIRPKPPI